MHRTSAALLCGCLGLLASSCSSHSLKAHSKTLSSVNYAPDEKEERIRVTGKPVFVPHSDFTELQIEGWNSKTVSPLSWPGDAPKAASLSPDRPYAFEILVSKAPNRQDTLTLSKVSDGEKQLFDADICPLHKEPMTREIERYFPSGEVTNGYFKAASRFPYSGTVWESCCFSGSWKTIVWRCPKCAEASQRWAKANL